MPRAVVVRETGGAEKLVFEERDPGPPGPGQVRVSLRAAGVNFIDTYHRSGLYPVELPFTPGSEGAGVVSAVGPDVTDVAVGDRVAWVGVAGSYSSHGQPPPRSTFGTTSELSTQPIGKPAKLV